MVVRLWKWGAGGPKKIRQNNDGITKPTIRHSSLWW